MPINLKNKSALITGGSAGVGAAVAKQLAAEGVNLAINYASSSERAESLAKELKEKYNIKVITIKADASKESEKLVSETMKAFGKLDIVISNAGWTKICPFEDLDGADEELWDGTFNMNVKAHFFLFKASKPYFELNEDGGTFIATASMAGRIPIGSSLPYSVSKAALIHLVKGLAKTNGPKCRVHAVCPGLVLTEWGKKFPENALQVMKDKSPIGTLTDVDETALYYISLCKSSTSTGSIISIDGGLTV